MNYPILELAERVWNGQSHVNDLRKYRPGYVEEILPGVAMIPGFGHAFAIDHGDGLALYDTGPRETAQALYEGVRSWSEKPLTHAVYSHGHLDHTFGIPPFDKEASESGRERPTVIAHENLSKRYRRYGMTIGYNTTINQRQFRNSELTWPATYRWPDVEVSDQIDLVVGSMTMKLIHQKGETDDHLIGFLPDQKILFPGDLFGWVTPNGGNPQKFQRYPLEWAQALRYMADLGAEIMLGSHGVPVQGKDRIRTVLIETAEYLESIVSQTLSVMNSGGTVLQAIHEVKPPAELLNRSYLQPVYDEPEFVVRMTWRLYGGWYDGNPSNLKPAPEAELAGELAVLVGGPSKLAERATELAGEGELRLAGHLAQYAVLAAPDDDDIHQVRADVYDERVRREPSTMARGIFLWTAAESEGAIAKITTHEALANRVKPRAV